MDILTEEKRHAALEDYLRIGEANEGLQPDFRPFPYHPVPALDQLRWRIPLADQMVDAELTELTNTLNGWKGTLRRWHAWVRVVADLDEDTRWGVELEFVEPLAFMAMFMPSSTRDRFGFIATNAMHQILMALDPSRKDHLVGDPVNPSKRARYPSRAELEKQLGAMVQGWSEGQSFMKRLQRLDGDDYDAATMNFRNRASHALAPRFTLGHVQPVTRECSQAVDLVLQQDGTYVETPVPDTMRVSYGFGGTPPLDMDGTRSTNLAQFEIAAQCFDAYVALLKAATSGMTKRGGQPS